MGQPFTPHSDGHIEEELERSCRHFVGRSSGRPRSMVNATIGEILGRMESVLDILHSGRSIYHVGVYLEVQRQSLATSSALYSEPCRLQERQ